MLDNERIPNFNSFSTLIDRISIEAVKSEIFRNKQREEGKSYAEQLSLQGKIRKELLEQLTDMLIKTWLRGDYTVISETRTFK